MGGGGGCLGEGVEGGEFGEFGGKSLSKRKKTEKNQEVDVLLIPQTNEMKHLKSSKAATYVFLILPYYQIMNKNSPAFQIAQKTPFFSVFNGRWMNCTLRRCVLPLWKVLKRNLFSVFLAQDDSESEISFGESPGIRKTVNGAK